jgi:hypothetical protein
MSTVDKYLTDTLVWSKQSDQGNVWRNAQIQLQSKSTFKLVFEVKRGRYYLGDVAVDDVSLFLGSCIQTHSMSHRCDFEDDKMCGYTNDATKKAAWVRYSTGKAFIMEYPKVPNRFAPGTDNTVSRQQRDLIELANGRNGRLWSF